MAYIDHIKQQKLFNQNEKGGFVVTGNKGISGNVIASRALQESL